MPIKRNREGDEGATADQMEGDGEGIDGATAHHAPPPTNLMQLRSPVIRARRLAWRQISRSRRPLCHGVSWGEGELAPPRGSTTAAVLRPDRRSPRGRPPLAARRTARGRQPLAAVFCWVGETGKMNLVNRRRRGPPAGVY